MNINSLTKLPTPVGNLQQYIQAVQTFPVLSAEQEQALAKRWRTENDPHAAWQLITSNLRYVVRIAGGYKGYGLPQEDLIQEGTIGLMKAVRKFDPARGVRLLAYAAYWIRAQIHDFIIDNWRMVKVTTTKAKRKLFYKLRSAKKRLDWLSNEEARGIADALDVEARDVISMEAQLYLSDKAFDLPVDAASDEWAAPAAYIADEGIEPETVVSEREFFSTASKALQDALPVLDSRNRDIIEQRWLAEDSEKATLQTLAAYYGVSRERIRQLEENAIKRLRKLVVPQLGLTTADDLSTE